jgi:ABC-type sugar transport system ATPase subunit
MHLATPSAELPAARMGEALLRMSGISKRFGAAVVLTDVQFDLRAGEVHVLAGENGAGKSTLMKILAGVITDFDGQIVIGGRPVRPRSPLEAAALGVSVIHQELSLVGPMSVADNISLARHPARAGFVQTRRQQRRARDRLARLGIDLDVRRPVEEYPIAIRQLIEIAKALSGEAKIIVMDEPTSALDSQEAARLFRLIRNLKESGCGIVYISHKMEEIESLADRITVLRDGRYVGTADAADLPIPKLIEWMVGREMAERTPRTPPPRASTPRLEVAGLSFRTRAGAKRVAVQDITLKAYPGEIVGLGGLEGSGASELLLGLFGAVGPPAAGEVRLDGRPVFIRSPRQAIAAGVSLLTNDRKETGLVLPLSITANISLASLPEISRGGWVSSSRERRIAADSASSLHIHARSLDLPVAALSGGNQQKVALAKWIQTRPRLMLLDEPTRGVDIGAKREIYKLINEWTRDGASILLITSEMSELLELSDRIYVMHRGRIAAELDRKEASAGAVLAAAMGGAAPASETSIQ